MARPSGHRHTRRPRGLRATDSGLLAAALAGEGRTARRGLKDRYVERHAEKGKVAHQTDRGRSDHHRRNGHRG